jgi:hypothetical protein
MARAEWLLSHCADPNCPHAYSGRPQHVAALVYGNQEMAELLERSTLESAQLVHPQPSPPGW